VSAWTFILSAAYKTDELVSLVQQIKEIKQKNKSYMPNGDFSKPVKIFIPSMTKS
jgi:hypothetical protein